jgi:hypothetical protein
MLSIVLNLCSGLRMQEVLKDGSGYSNLWGENKFISAEDLRVVRRLCNFLLVGTRAKKVEKLCF